MQESLNLKEYFNIFKKRGWMIILITMIFVAVTGILNFFVIKPVYQAQLTFMVNFNQNQEAQISIEDMEYGTNLVEKYKPIIKSRKVTNTIKENLKLNMTPSEIGNSIEISSISGSVMSVTVNHTNPTLAARVANEVPKVFGGELKRIAKVNGIEVIDTAVVPVSPISPNKIRNMIIAALVGIIMSVCIILLLDYFDSKVKTVEDIEKYLDLPVLGEVFEFEGDKFTKKSKLRLKRKRG